MLKIVLFFALITALFESALLLKFSSVRMLNKGWFVACIHTLVVALNLLVHWGTIVGTMTAITAGLVSFVTVPVVRVILEVKPEITAKCDRLTTKFRKLFKQLLAS